MPGKNLRRIGGKSLLQRAIEAAMQSKYVTSVIVSTDDENISEKAIKYGAEVPFLRPHSLASDSSDEWSAWQHAVNFSIAEKNTDEESLFVSVPTTSPLKSSKHINRCIEYYLENSFDVVVTGYKSGHHPAFNMVRRASDRSIELIQPLQSTVPGRQLVPFSAYMLSTVCYVTNFSYILHNSSIFDQRIGMFEIDQRTGIDIDTELDLEIARLLLADDG